MVDEFSELLTAKPDFIELFLAIGRIGRSIGVHLLLASQRLEEGRLRGLESFLSYRIGLRTFNAQESRAVLDVPDAYELPPVPGSGYLKVDTTLFERFKAAFVSGPATAVGGCARGRGQRLRAVPAAQPRRPAGPARGRGGPAGPARRPPRCWTWWRAGWPRRAPRPTRCGCRRCRRLCRSTRSRGR